MLTITGIQTLLNWENPAANRSMFEEKIKAIKEKTEVIILPETFSTGFSMKPKELAETMEGYHKMDEKNCFRKKIHHYRKRNY